MSEELNEQPDESTPVEPDLEQETDKPPFEGEFDPERARRTIDTLRANEKAARARLAELEREKREREDAEKSEAQRLQEQFERANDSAAKYRDRAVLAEAKAAAVDFADPADAVKFIDASSYVDEGGDIDTARLQVDLAAVLEAKPYLARTQEQPSRPRMKPNPAQGKTGDAPPSRSELIRDMETTGDYKAAQALKAQQLFELNNQTK